MTETHQWTIVNVRDSSTGHTSSAKLVREAGYRLIEASTNEEACSVAEREGSVLLLLEGQESEKFRVLADQAPAFIWMNGPDGCEFVNRAYLEFLGIHALDVQSFDWAQFMHPHDRKRYITAYLEAVVARSLFEATVRFRRHDGQYRWMKSVGTPRCAADGAFFGYAGSTLDITEVREQPGEAPMAREEFVSMVLNSLPEEIVVIDAQGVILAVNESWQRFAEKNGGNFNTAMPIGMNYLDSCRIGATAGDPYAAEMLVRLEDILLGRVNTCSVEYPCHSPNRRQWFVMNASQSVRLPRLIVISHLDITARKEAEEALRQREEQLKQFNVELERKVTERTVKLLESEERLRALATELNLAEQRERKRLAIELHDHLQQMLVLGKIKLGQGKRLADPIPACAALMKETDEVLSDALAYTRTLVADLSPTVLRDHGLAAGLLWLGEYMQKHGTAVAVRVSDHEVTLPEDQKLLLFQSVRELLINASKHAGTAQAAVSLDQRDGQLRIDVCDEGVGFDLAAAAVAGTSHGGISSKFGLFSIQERMRVLGGSFNIQSAPGQGTTATLMLPLQTE